MVNKQSILKKVLAKNKGRKFKTQPTPVVELDQEVADIMKDKRRFFKEEIEEDKRSLFFA